MRCGPETFVFRGADWLGDGESPGQASGGNSHLGDQQNFVIGTVKPVIRLFRIEDRRLCGVYLGKPDELLKR